MAKKVVEEVAKVVKAPKAPKLEKKEKVVKVTKTPAPEKVAKVSKTAKKDEIPLDDRMLEVVKSVLEEHKAENIEVMDLRGKTSIASYMIIATGTSTRHNLALAEYVRTALKKLKVKVEIEGKENADWILLDGFDVIVHLFKEEVRDFYSLDKMWKALLEAKPGKETKE